jgi:rubrerythrin
MKGPDMTTLTPTKSTGATAKPAPMLYIDPACQVDDEQLAASMALDGINSVFVADLLSAMLTHERCGTHLYRSVAQRSHNPMLQHRYEQFGEETAQHVDILERLIAESGGNPQYVSAMARAREGADSKLLESTFMLNGAVDLMTTEMAMLDAVFVAESIDHDNWQALAKLVSSLPEGATRDSFRAAVEQVETQEDEHLEWARETRGRLVDLQARSTLVGTVSMKTEEVIARIQSWFSN